MRSTKRLVASAAVIAAATGAWWLVAGHDDPRPTRPPVSASPLRPTASPWTSAQLRELISAVEQADAQGLRASDYNIDALREVAQQGRTDADVDALANSAAVMLARDFAGGHVRGRHRFNWYIDYAGPAPAELARSIASVRARGKLREWLTSLLPSSPDYIALRDALASTQADDPERRDRIRANMERWRWLPRDMGEGDQLYVNLPSYRLDVIEAGSTVASYKAVIGATDMPTPVLAATVRQVVANPDWIVPDSIVRRSHLRPGASSRYIFSKRPDGTMRVRQKPGPGNALGRVKIIFPNPLAIYFHDTPSRSLFGASARTFSHGCVRVQNIDQLATSLVASPDRFRTALAGTQTRWFSPARTWRATIVYLTLVRGESGALTDLGDPYHVDEPLAAALDHRKPRAGSLPAAVVAKPAADQQGLASAKKADEGAPAEPEQVIPNAAVAEPLDRSDGQ